MREFGCFANRRRVADAAFGVVLALGLVASAGAEQEKRIVFPQPDVSRAEPRLDPELSRDAPVPALSRMVDSPPSVALSADATVAASAAESPVVLINGTRSKIVEVRLNDPNGVVIAQNINSLDFTDTDPAKIVMHGSPYGPATTFNTNGIYVRFEDGTTKSGSAIVDQDNFQGTSIIWIFANGLFTSNTDGAMLGVTF